MSVFAIGRWGRRPKTSQARIRRPHRGRWEPRLEFLETRVLPSTSAGFFNPTYVLHRAPTPNGNYPGPLSTPGPTGTTPTQIRHAYGFDQITFSNGSVAGDGSGQTIAIVDAYDDPNIASDLHQFDVQFGLSDPTFTKVNQSGGSTMPAANSGWISEIALDVEWAHAIAPKANILLVEANDNSFANLFAAIQYAASQPGVAAVSMSWGGGEFSGESSYDSYFLTPSGHSGVTFLASSGDNGAPPEYPSISPNVVSVGGTTLNLDSSGNILGESAWSGSGGGISAYESQPGYQSGVVTQSTTKRASPDVSYDADPNTGFPVYDSYNNGTASPWSQFGGTSDAAPQWAALIAIADQGRALAGKAALDGAGQTLANLYSISSNDYHDITSGSSTGSPSYTAGAGYDLVTGRGTPLANLVVNDLVGQNTAGVVTHYSVTGPSSSTAGSAFNVTVTALDANNNAVAGYTGTVHFSSSDAAAVLPADYTFTAADGGAHTFGVTLKTAGSRTVTATDTANASVTGSLGVSVSPGAATHLAFGQQPSNVTAGAVIAPAVTVRVLDAYNNLLTADNTDQVRLALGSNPGGGTLGGTTAVTVSGGVATFSNLTVSNAGNGYTLVASSGSLAGATSNAFNVTAPAASGTVIEPFETSRTWYIVGGTSITGVRATYAAHDGTYGLDDYNGNDWIYRTDAGAQIKAGDRVFTWVYLYGSADGRGYFGFGASSGGALSAVVAPNTGQLLIQNNAGWGYTNLAAVNQVWQANHWYRLEVNWASNGGIVVKLYDSNGTTLLNTVSASQSSIMSGGIAFRATGSDKFWDTVTAVYGAGGSGGGSGGSNPSLQPAAGGPSGSDQATRGIGATGRLGSIPADGTTANRTPGAIFSGMSAALVDQLFAGTRPEARPAAPSAVAETWLELMELEAELLADL